MPLNKLIEFYRGRKNRIKFEEVESNLSRHIWKTKNRILEEILQERKSTGQELPVLDGIILDAKRDVTVVILDLYREGVLGRKYDYQLSEEEQRWSADSDQDYTDIALQVREDLGHHLLFYKLNSPSKRSRKKLMDEGGESFIDKILTPIET